MRRPMPLPFRNLLPLVLLAVSLGCLAKTPSAHAGIGDLVKKAKSKAAQAMGQKPASEASKTDCPDPVFDDVTLELTEARVTRILATFEATAKAGEGRPALAEKLAKLQEDRGALDQKEGEKVRDLQRRRDDVQSCYHDGYKAAEERRGEEYKNRALSDPALIAKFSKLAQENNAAAARGDSAAMARMNQAMAEELAPTREDSIQVAKKCGPVPPRSAAEDKLNAYDKQIAEVQEQIRAIDAKVFEAQAKDSGFSNAQWAAALERITAYRGWHDSHAKGSGKGKSSGSSGSSGSSESSSGGSGGQAKGATTAPCGFTPVEAAAIEKHLAALTDAMR